MGESHAERRRLDYGVNVDVNMKDTRGFDD